MAVIDVELATESQNRYLTYALSVVNSRALPDVRDGLKPVQRRILYAMSSNLRLNPDKAHRKSAAVVGEVLARYHPHGDSACYDAMVRMAQDFNVRYPLVDGQGNFGSLDGDSAAAYRYTEARLTAFALEVIGDIGQQTVAERDNFDQTVTEPVVLPSRVPNLLVNGSSGIAVGMATSIPPHNLTEVTKALQMLIADPSTADSKISGAIKGPDFPTGCAILNSKAEFKKIYKEGRGAIRMRGEYEEESSKRGKKFIIITSIPYAVDKSSLVEKIADVIIAKKLPQLVDIRDESTDEVRIVLEPTSQADTEKVMAYLFKHTPLESNFNVNLTALVPTENPLSGKPTRMSLRQMLQQFIDFRIEVIRRKLHNEKAKLEERIHLLDGIVSIYDVLDEVIKIVRKSEGRSDAAAKLQKRFKLSEIQAFFIVDLRIYQLSKTSIEEVTAELKEKQKRVREINKILKSKAALNGEVSKDLDRVVAEFGDARRCRIENSFEEVEFDAESYVQHEDVNVVVSKDGWIKRISASSDPESTRIREGDELFFTELVSTKDVLIIYSSLGNMYGVKGLDLTATSGYGLPVQKMFKFADGEQIAACAIISSELPPDGELFLYTKRGLGLRLPAEMLGETKKNGKRLVKVRDGDALAGVRVVDKDLFLLISAKGYGVCFHKDEVPLLSSAGKGVILQKMPDDDELIVAKPVSKKDKIRLEAAKGALKEVEVKSLTIGTRAKRGLKVVKRGTPVVRELPEAK